MYRNEDGSVPATYQIYYMIGWKYHDSQVILLRQIIYLVGSCLFSFYLHRVGFLKYIYMMALRDLM